MRFRTVFCLIFLAAAGCADGKGDEPVSADVVPFVRITASDTLHLAFPWPIEAVDGPAAIRDSDDTTSWKIPVSEETTLTLDLLPAFTDPIPLERAGITISGQPRSVFVDVSDFCGSLSPVTLEWTDTANPLDLSGHVAGCVSVRFDTDSDVAVEGLSLIATLPADSVTRPEPDPLQARVPGDLMTGVIEGFYGVPWSFSERRRVMDMMSVTGMGTYLYCPKWDPLHRDEWRQPYSDSQLADFADLIAWADKRGVTFSFGISPFIDFDYQDDSDYDLLLNKIMDFVNIGVKSVTLLADDIEFETAHPIDSSMGAVHAAVVNLMLGELRETVPGIEMAFCPTVYSDARLDSLGDGAGYLSELSALDPDIRIFWTGPHTSDLEMTAGDMVNFSAITGRKPLIWDNFWANDGGDGFLGRILLGPFSGRDADLVGAVDGVMHNPSIQGGLARLSLGTFADFMIDPVGFDLDSAVDFSVSLETNSSAVVDSEQVSNTLRFIMELFDGNAQVMPGHRGLRNLAEVITQKIGSDVEEDARDEVVAMLDLLARMSVVRSEVHHSRIAADIVDELFFPLMKVEYESLTALTAIEAMVEKMGGRAATDLLVMAADYLWQSNSCRFTFGQGEIESLLRAVEGMAISDGPSGLLPVTILEPSCVVGQPCRIDVSTPLEGARMVVAGLPGASISDGVIQWTPLHAGKWRLAVVAWSEDSGLIIGHSIVDFVCQTMS